ncbi:unnamed protein product [Orchesella dallaii]|uniref:Uncharacterized protein n=1 Tax=Orchesella dallaii TaxID=48710 RepID=A0ABP1RVQ6_9HEXA
METSQLGLPKGYSGAKKQGESLPYTTLTIWTEMVCGILAAAFTAFANDKVNGWAYVIFLAYLAFSTGLFYYLGREVCSESKENDDLSVSMSWGCLICTTVTFSLFGILYFYYTELLGTPVNSMVTAICGIQVLTVAFLGVGYLLLVQFFPKANDTFPLVVIAFMVVLGNGLFATTRAAFYNDQENAWAYAIFGIYITITSGSFCLIVRELWSHMTKDRAVSGYTVWASCIAVTASNFVIFIVLFYTQFTFPSPDPLPTLQNEIMGACVVYSGAADALLLLLIRWRPPLVSAGKDGDREDDDDNCFDSEFSVSSADHDVEKGMETCLAKPVMQNTSGSTSTLGPESGFDVRVI